MAKREPECMPCRGTGKVISNLGGEQRHIPCPWCEGTGVKHGGIDAQAAWLDGEGSAAKGAVAGHGRETPPGAP